MVASWHKKVAGAFFLFWLSFAAQNVSRVAVSSALMGVIAMAVAMRGVC